MKKLTLAMGLVLLLAIACNSEKKNAASDSTKADSTAAKPIDTAAMNKAWAAYMTPGAAHQMIAKV